MSGSVLVSIIALVSVLGAAAVFAALGAWRSLQRRLDQMSAVFESNAGRLAQQDGEAAQSAVPADTDSLETPASPEPVEAETALSDKQAEELQHRLQQKIDEFDQLMDLLPVAVWVSHDAECRKISCNRTAFELMGAAMESDGEEQVTSVHFRRDGKDLLPEELPWAVAAREGKATGYTELEMVLPDKTMRYVFGGSVPLLDSKGKARGSLTALNDISQRKQAEDSLQFIAQIGSELAMLGDSQSVAQKVAALAVPFLADFCVVDIVDTDGLFKREGIAHLDLKKERILRDMAVNECQAHPAMSSQILILDSQTEMLEVLAPGSLQELALRELNPRSCLRVPVTIRGSLAGVISLFVSNGRPGYAENDTSIAWDLAWRTSVALENAHLYLETREANRRKDEMFSILVNGLRNPLFAMADKGADAHGYQIRQLAHLTDNFLEAMRFESGEIRMHRDTVSVTDVCRKSTEKAGVLPELQACQIKVDLGTEFPAVVGDVSRLEQALINLLTYASHHALATKPISVSLRSDSGFAVIVIRGTANGNLVCFTSGCLGGIPGSIHCDNLMSSGCGIRLRVARRIIEMHAGSLLTESGEKGREFKVTVRLPLATSESVLAARNNRSLPEKSRLKMLIADDNKNLALMTSALLRGYGHDVEVVHDGAAAIEAFQRFIPDVLLLDIGLPALDGYEVAERLRASGFRETLFIAVTGYGQDRDRARSAAAGFDHHLTKPLDYSILAPLVAAWQEGDRAKALREKKNEAAVLSGMETGSRTKKTLEWADC